ncbi:MAG: hypothetical protein AB1428_12265 [Bacteroidota bacterium]
MKSLSTLIVVAAFSLILHGCQSEYPLPVAPVILSVAPIGTSPAKGGAGGETSQPYREKFKGSPDGWVKAAGPGILEVVDGAFRHTSNGFSVWCEYFYSPRTFGNGKYGIDVYVVDGALNTAFGWRAPSVSEVTANGGAYQITFNNSGLAPGPAGHFTFEKFDPQGRTMLLDLPNQFLGLNHVVIDDRGTSVEISVNGVKHGPINVQTLTAPQAGYIYLVGGDRGGGDYFDNIKFKPK